MADEEPKNGGLVKPSRRIAIPKLHQKVAQASVTQVSPDTMPNRIGLMLDCSGSMSEEAEGKSKMDHLKDAVQGFVAACDFSNTALALETFPSKKSLNLSVLGPFFTMEVMSLEPNNGTPMAEAIEKMLMTHSVTRSVIVSDGCANRPDDAEREAQKFREAGIPIDCVHIGRDASGEELLQKIAELTGGIFVKFDNVANFAKNFKYLTPAYRGMLTAGSAAMLGAREVK